MNQLENVQDACKVAGSAKSRVTMVVSSLRCGGIERAVVSLTHGLLARGHQVSVITFADGSTDFFQLPQGAQRTSLGIRGGRRTPLLRLIPATRMRVRALRDAIKSTRPDVVVSHAPPVNVPTLLALRRASIPVIVTEHGDVPVIPDPAGPLLWRKWVWYRLRRVCYPAAFKVVSASNAIDRNVAWLPSARRAVIHNPFPPVDDLALPAQWPAGLTVDRPWIVSMGRLDPAKGQDVLLAAFTQIAARFPQWQLVIIGDGDTRAELYRQAGDLIADGQVVFTGDLAAPFGLLRRAQFFAMGSRYEGFPMAVGEALACGLPVLATDCPSRPRKMHERHPVAGGVRELVQDGVNGRLVPSEDPTALAAAMADLIERPQERLRLAQQAVPSMQRFSCDRVMDDWERLFEQARSSATSL